MQLSIYSLKQVLFEGEVKSLNCKTITGGEITILNNHQTLITALSSGTIKVVDSKEKEHFFAVESGFLEVKPDNRVRLIVK